MQPSLSRTQSTSTTPYGTHLNGSTNTINTHTAHTNVQTAVQPIFGSAAVGATNTETATLTTPPQPIRQPLANFGNLLQHALAPNVPNDPQAAIDIKNEAAARRAAQRRAALNHPLV